MPIPKKVAAIHDIAGFGRSSLTVVIPVMSVMGHQTCPVPTAVLSSITGFYEGYEMLDLSSYLPAYLSHWEREGFHFDCVYSGFLGSAAQADIACGFIERLSVPLVVVDPVFADDGKLYSCFDESIIGAMRTLVKKADIITPNATEAAFLLGEKAAPPNTKSALLCARELSAMGPASVIITSVPDTDNKISVVVYDAGSGEGYKISNPYLRHAHYPGTGDLFTSVLTGHILNGNTALESASRAAKFVFMSIERACENNVPRKEGVPLELMLSHLTENNGLEIERLK